VDYLRWDKGSATLHGTMFQALFVRFAGGKPHLQRPCVQSSIPGGLVPKTGDLCRLPSVVARLLTTIR